MFGETSYPNLLGDEPGGAYAGASVGGYGVSQDALNRGANPYAGAAVEGSASLNPAEGAGFLDSVANFFQNLLGQNNCETVCAGPKADAARLNDPTIYDLCIRDCQGANTQNSMLQNPLNALKAPDPTSLLPGWVPLAAVAIFAVWAMKR